MSLIELILIALGLSMDAFAVSLCKGLAMKRLLLRHCLLVGLWFGFFQALMPLLGYLLGAVLGSYISALDHWIAFVLLCLIGLNMLRESFGGVEDDEKEEQASLKPGLMFGLAVATSIDAFAVGITFALLPSVHIVAAVLLIGGITFVLSVLAVKLGHLFGKGQGAWAERLGGLILIAIGLKILLEHLGVFG